MLATNATYNSDLSTYSLFKQLEQQFQCYVSSSTWRNELDRPRFEVTSDFVQKIIYPKMKQEAETLAEKIAITAANRTERWKSAASTTLAHRIIEILFSNGIRRGSIPSKEELLHRREILIRNGLASDEDLRFAILMLPIRDRNKAKNDGYLPDLGEIISLLQLWAIVKAMFIATENFAQVLIKIFKKVDGSVETITDIQNSIEIMLKEDRVAIDCSQQKHNYYQLDLLREALNDDYKVTNSKQAALLRELTRCNYTNEWFLQSLAEVIQVQTKSIRIFVVQDVRRYACYDTDLNEHIQAYSTCLNQIVVEMGLDESIILTSHEQLEKDYPNLEDLETFMKQRTEVYSNKFEEFSQPFFQRKSDLMHCTTRESFLILVNEISLNENISQLIEPILHSRYHPKLADAQLTPSDELILLAQIYQPQIADTNRELLRQELLFSSLINATKYICSYESQTSTKNIFQLDDIQFFLPGTVRLSIHNKSSNCDQFLIKCGPNLHRQPWQGTAGLRLRKNKGKHSLSFEIRLSFEYKVDNYIPVFIKKDSVINSNYSDHFSALALIDQPIIWIHSDLVQMYVTNENDLSRIFDKDKKIRLI
ncbi:unnamed protein product [Rotaria sp. Silwood2]|nr:unnamed protein product [Rotaria sp. Silwood2]CAF4503975.1 unnamed protein product [Rotaria sp. Silwood2]CAF4510281.1 unnamed protein product [Rotaria sp. Silwood2]